MTSNCDKLKNLFKINARCLCLCCITREEWNKSLDRAVSNATLEAVRRMSVSKDGLVVEQSVSDHEAKISEISSPKN